MKIIITFSIIILSVVSVFAQQTAYQYSYDNIGNRTLREMIVLPTIAPGGGNAVVQNPLVVQIPIQNKSTEAGRAEEVLELSLYPNPTTSSVNVKFGQADITTDEVRIIDNNGNIMYSQKTK